MLPQVKQLEEQLENNQLIHEALDTPPPCASSDDGKTSSSEWRVQEQLSGIMQRVLILQVSYRVLRVCCIRWQTWRI